MRLVQFSMSRQRLQVAARERHDQPVRRFEDMTLRTCWRKRDQRPSSVADFVTRVRTAPSLDIIRIA